MDSHTISGYFIGYPEKSKGYRFYHPNHSSRIVKTSNAKFMENGKVSGNVENQVVDINETRDDDPSPMYVHKSTTTPDVVLVFQNQEQYLNNDQTPHEENNLTSEPVGITLNKPARVRKSAIHDDYIVCLQETDFDIGIDNDLVSFFTSHKRGSKRVGCKWVLKTKRDSKGNFERYKARLVAKVAHFDLKLHQMDVTTAFLNGNIGEEVYTKQPEGFFLNGKEKMDYLQRPILIKFLRDSSIMEAEFVACYEATIHALWSRNIISRLGCSKGAKHMDIKFFIVKEEIQKQRVYLKHISTDLMIADPLTKGLPPKEEFTQHVPEVEVLVV
ncbi:retrovirus-related pol polyprotein from transposon TNT 1-94 [Tanacetum coccineum]